MLDKGTPMGYDEDVGKETTVKKLGTLTFPKPLWQWEIEVWGDGDERHSQIAVESGSPEGGPRYFYRMEVGINSDTDNFVVVGYRQVGGWGYDNPPDVDEWHPEEEFASVGDAIEFAQQKDLEFFNAQV